MQTRISPEALTARCAALEALGFECIHRDSNMVHPAIPGVRFDFSATDASKFVYVALQRALSVGKVQGANSVRKQFSDLMEPDTE